MSKTVDWDYRLRIQGVSTDTLGMARLAQYMARFAELMGDASRPVYAGIVKGSVVLRARDRSDYPALTRSRLQSAANDDQSSARKAFEEINSLMNTDGARGDVQSRQGLVILIFSGKVAIKPLTLPDLVVHDRGELDGEVVSVIGADDTVHLRLRDLGGVTHKIVVVDLALAQRLAAKFRAGKVRVQVHGSWRRTAEGRWEPLSVYADSAEDLDETPADQVMETLRQVPGNGWNEYNDPLGEWARLRGIGDLRS